jgi:hypothetical protein
MRTPHWAIEQYERGNLNETEKFLLLTQAVTEKNAVSFVASLTREQLREVKAYIDGCPGTDEGWSKLRFYHIVSCVRPLSAEEVEAERAEELRLHRRGVEILRDVVGPEVAVAPSWRGRFTRGVLADAGCSDEGVLKHCRKQGVSHVRGCWVIDLLLNKE